jgi:hypothetical protein
MKIVGQLVVGPGEADRYLEQTLKEFHRLTDDAIAVTCNATRKEIKLLKKYDIRNYADQRNWGVHQPNIKTDLLKKIQTARADYVLCLDADEVTPTLTRTILQDIASGREACFFYVVNLWNDERHYIRTGPAGPFWNVRAYQADPSKGIQFLRKPLHCGNAPPYFYTRPAKDSYVPHILLHRGLMLPADRQRKAERYAQYDPNAVHKGREYYDALVADGTGTEYNQATILAKITSYVQHLQH